MPNGRYKGQNRIRLVTVRSRPRVLAPLVISQGEADKPKACPLPRDRLFCAPSARLKQAWPFVLNAKKPALWRWLLACAERPRFELGDQKNRSQLSRLLHYHSATSPRNSASLRHALATCGRAKIVKSFHAQCDKMQEFVSCRLQRRLCRRFDL